MFTGLTRAILFALILGVGATSDAANPNIVWIIVDDMSANFSCYGETLVETPNVDQLAKRGTQFNSAFVTAPVCSTCRSAFITGMYQTAIGSHHHRSGRGEMKINLPDRVELVPSLFQKAGYHTSITGWPMRKGRLGKRITTLSGTEKCTTVRIGPNENLGNRSLLRSKRAAGKCEARLTKPHKV